MPNKNIVILHDHDTKLQILKAWGFFLCSQLHFVHHHCYLLHLLLLYSLLHLLLFHSQSVIVPCRSFHYGPHFHILCMLQISILWTLHHLLLQIFFSFFFGLPIGTRYFGGINLVGHVLFSHNNLPLIGSTLKTYISFHVLSQ